MHEALAATILSGHTGTVTGCAFSPDGQVLATCSGDWDKSVRLWDATTGEALRTLDRHVDWVHACAFSTDGEVLATVSSGWTVRLWDPTTGQEVTDRRRYRRRYRDIVRRQVLTRGRASSPDGEVVAVTAGGWDPVVRLYHARTGRLLRCLEGHEAWVHGCWFGPDGTMLATVSGDHTARLWDPRTGDVLAVLRGHDGWVTSGAFDPAGSSFATTSVDRTARLWPIGDLAP